MDALKVETKFAFKVWITQKRVKPELSESSSSSSSSTGGEDNESKDEKKGLKDKMLKSGASLLRIDQREKSES